MGFHYLAFRTFCQATEDEEKVTLALRYASGAEGVERSASEGYHGNKIVVLENAIRSKKKTDAFFDRLSDSDVAQILETLEQRVNEECALFFRLDKQEAYLGRLVVTKGDDVISVRAKIECYPKRRENALEQARQYFGSILSSASERAHSREPA
ncbi:MAG: hypothetical protein LUO79_00010 [Methanomassiliicoccales archaeon]|nr:hypothetical protein [Methanomassiliicoccales archaeon]